MCYTAPSGVFQSTPPVWGATRHHRAARMRPRYFNPRPPCGGRRTRSSEVPNDFLISIHAPRVGGDIIKAYWLMDDDISIHAPRVGGDYAQFVEALEMADFNPRPPCGGRRSFMCYTAPSGVFQSTPPVWGATRHHRAARMRPRYFNPRPPCGGRRTRSSEVPNDFLISIHAPRVGGDIIKAYWLMDDDISIHAPRVGGDPQKNAKCIQRVCISIHAPRVGGDSHRKMTGCPNNNFNPRPPCGGRLWWWSPVILLVRKNFNPRPPCGGRPQGRAGTRNTKIYFNPRPPCGGRLAEAHDYTDANLFQSTPPVWGATRRGGYGQRRAAISIHAPRVGGDS